MEEEALVEAVKACRNIYNPALTAYHNNDRREKAWKVVSEEICQSGTYDWYSIMYSNYLNSHVVYTCLCRCTTSVNILNVINESLEQSLFTLA